MPEPRANASLQELIGQALKETADLARKEIALFRAEMIDNATGFAKGAGMFIAAAVFAVAALIWLTQALVYGLELIIHSRWLSALIVGGALLLIAGALVAAGRNMMSSKSLAPTRTVASLKRDSDLISDRVT